MKLDPTTVDSIGRIAVIGTSPWWLDYAVDAAIGIKILILLVALTAGVFVAIKEYRRMKKEGEPNVDRS